MQLNFNNVKGSGLGYLASAAIRAFVSNSPDNMKKVKVTDFDITIQLNGEEVDMEKFASILNTEARLLSGKAQYEQAMKSLELVENSTPQLSPSEIASKVVKLIVKDLGGEESKVAALITVPSLKDPIKDYNDLLENLRDVRTRLGYIDI